MKRFLYCVHALCIISPCYAEQVPRVDLEPIVVEKYLVSVQTIDRAFIQKISSGGIEDLADVFSSVEIRERGGSGIQQDISIRGSGFEDSTITLNGIPLNDPQTGHFTLDIPFVTSDVDSTMLDANALSLHYSIKSSPVDRVTMTHVAGSHNFWEHLLSWAFGTPPQEATQSKNHIFRHQISLKEESSKGARPDTDFDKYSASFISAYQHNGIETEMLIGFLKKDFGADGFYAAPAYTQEEEHIRKQFFLFRLRLRRDICFEWTPYLIRNRDTFYLNRHNPAFFTNIHTTTQRGIQQTITLPDRTYLTTAIREELIDSTNLKKHDRTVFNVLIGTEKRLFDAFFIKASAGRVMVSGDIGNTTQASCEISYQTTSAITPFIRYDRIYRLPSFTELYYVSPTNLGNESLDIQTADNSEAGFLYQKGPRLARLSFFRRQQHKTIDWIRSSPTEAWQAMNVGKNNLWGIDCSYTVVFPSSFIEKIHCAYTFTQQETKSAYAFSKYAFDLLKHKVVITSPISVGRFNLNPTLIYEHPQGNKKNRRVIGSIKATFTPRKETTYFLEIDNLFNTGYEELDYIKAAGRWIRGGITVTF